MLNHKGEVERKKSEIGSSKFLSVQGIFVKDINVGGFCTNNKINYNKLDAFEREDSYNNKFQYRIMHFKDGGKKYFVINYNGRKNNNKKNNNDNDDNNNNVMIKIIDNGIAIEVKNDR